MSTIYRAKTKYLYRLNLNDSPVSSYRPRLVSWVENFIVAPMLSISCDRNQQCLVPACILEKQQLRCCLRNFSFLWNIKMRYHVRMNQPLLTNLGHLNSGHTFTPFSFKMRFNIFLLCTLKSSNWILAVECSDYNLLCIFPMTRWYFMIFPPITLLDLLPTVIDEHLK